MMLRRYGGNPILKPKPDNDWESKNVFNPTVVYDRGLFHLLYRGMGRDGISRIGYAVSIDGFDCIMALTRIGYTDWVRRCSAWKTFLSSSPPG